jgi:uncharacterized phage protein (predicted DNA packaging)
MLEQVKKFLRISHDKLDDEIQGEIDAGLLDLKVHGITHAPSDDALIVNAVKLWCKSLHTDDPAKAAEFLRRYKELRDCLKMAEGYGWKEAGADE